MNDESLELVDAHVHFWDRARMPYPWLAGEPAIAGPHSPPELTREAGGSIPDAIVFVEAGADGEHARAEVEWVSELAALEPRISGIVAQVAVDRGAETEAALAALGGQPLVRGVRHNLQDHPEPDHCLRPSFLDGVARVGEGGWTFDVCIRHRQLPACIELVRRCPGTTFVLDHAGKPDIRGGVVDPWRAHIAELARLPNVSCKLSGLVTEADPSRWTLAGLRPYVEHLLDSFGPYRLLFGSDWPVVKLAATYRRWLEVAMELLAPLAGSERAAVLGENARRVYRLPSPPRRRGPPGPPPETRRVSHPRGPPGTAAPEIRREYAGRSSWRPSPVAQQANRWRRSDARWPPAGLTATTPAPSARR